MSALDVQGVSVSFGGRLALDGVSLSAEHGRITGLIGPNGAGKTTLFNVICGLQAPTEGSVSIAGADVTALAPFKRARRGLARTFQRLELFGLLSVHENVHLATRVAGRAGTARRAHELLERLGIADLADARADRLSTGKARLVELARAMATEPDVLLLDEPASGQDDTETATFAGVLQDVASSGVAVVLIEHDIKLVMDVCATINVLDLGRVLARGTAAEVQQDDAVVRAYLGQVT